MPIKHAAEKAMRQTKKRTLRNSTVLRTIEVLENKARKLVTQKSADARGAVISLQKAVDRAVQRHVVKPNRGARWKARLMKLVQ